MTDLPTDLPTSPDNDAPSSDAAPDSAGPAKKKPARKRRPAKATAKPIAKKTATKPAEKTTKKTTKAASRKAAAAPAEDVDTVIPPASRVAIVPVDDADDQADDQTADEPDTDAPAPDDDADTGPQADAEAEAQPEPDPAAKPKRSRRGRGKSDKAPAPQAGTPAATPASRPAPKPAASAKPADPRPTPADMIVNYVPGEECRIAIVEDGQLEEFYSEPTDKVSRVGNIYVGRVTNVESAIQAAFVDFGIEENGFLHVSDLHPQYFPGEDEDTTERVGKKIPRRSRPPIQQCLKRGQEIIVQVLKEGVGTKGPSLTSYLSIPGRFLVMMPQMDKVGVSRKEEDDDRRREARAILDQLELPEGFGFILRTAGFDRTKTELKRDLAYLQRLWKDMEARRSTGNKPRLLYSESDLLVRSLRDLLNTDVQRVVIDNEHALQRAARFMRIVAPRHQAKLVHYTGKRPVFHAFNIEEQIRQIHSREVPLPSGGRLIIEQTEALVAIDVNSGKSRSANDAETNAYRTNVEAVDAICRQLRLRDLGGLVINDLIDMRHISHRKDIENRFKERLKRDRARTTTLQISEFGILEMTRQRMRGSQESLHFTDCPICHGRGIVQRPESVASDGLRELANILDHERIARVELVVHPRVAGSLLSAKRTGLTRIELASGKHVDVRVSDAIPIDRVSFYAYDASGSDLDLERLPKRKEKPELTIFDDGRADPDSWAADIKAEAEHAATASLAEQLAEAAASHETQPDPIIELSDLDDDTDDAPASAGTAEQGTGKKKRRRRRKKRSGSAQDASAPNAAQPPAGDADTDTEPSSGPDNANASDSPPGEGGRKKRRRRRRRRGGAGNADSTAGSTPDAGPDTDADTATDDQAPEEHTAEDQTTHDQTSEDQSTEDQATDDSAAASAAPAAGEKKKRRRRRGGRGRNKRDTDTQDGPPTPAPAPSVASKPSASAEPKPARPAPANNTPAPRTPAQPEPASPKRRTLYSAGRRKLNPSEIGRGPKD